MSQNILIELRFLLYAITFGALVAAVYDCFRIIRRVCPHKNFLVSMEDLLFWLAMAVTVFYLLNAQSDGRLRWFFIVGAALGMLLYRVSLSRLLVPGGVVVVRFVLKPLSVCGRILRKTGHRGLTYTKKKLTACWKVLRMILCKQ